MSVGTLPNVAAHLYSTLIPLSAYFIAFLSLLQSVILHLALLDVPHGKRYNTANGANKEPGQTAQASWVANVYTFRHHCILNKPRFLSVEVQAKMCFGDSKVISDSCNVFLCKVDNSRY